MFISLKSSSFFVLKINSGIVTLWHFKEKEILTPERSAKNPHCTWLKQLVSLWQHLTCFTSQHSSQYTCASTDHLRWTKIVSSGSLLPWRYGYYPSLPFWTPDGDLPTPHPSTSQPLQPVRMSVTAKLLPMCVWWFHHRDFVTSSHRNTFRRQTISYRPVSIPFTFEKCYKSAERVKKKREKFQGAGQIRILFYRREGKLWNCFFFNLAVCFFFFQYEVFRSFHFYYGDHSFRTLFRSLWIYNILDDQHISEQTSKRR